MTNGIEGGGYQPDEEDMAVGGDSERIDDVDKAHARALQSEKFRNFAERARLEATELREKASKSDAFLANSLIVHADNLMAIADDYEKYAKQVEDIGIHLDEK